MYAIRSYYEGLHVGAGRGALLTGEEEGLTLADFFGNGGVYRGQYGEGEGDDGVTAGLTGEVQIVGALDGEGLGSEGDGLTLTNGVQEGSLELIED